MTSPSKWDSDVIVRLLTLRALSYWRGPRLGDRYSDTQAEPA